MGKSLNTKDTTKYASVRTKKGLMSQLFDENSYLIPFTSLRLENTEDIKLFDGYTSKTIIKIEGNSKGKGFQGVMRRWNFSGGPATHGTKDKHRGGGSIGAQGQGRVIPGKKMPGRMGNDRISVVTKFLGVDADKNIIMVKGAVPGSINSDVTVFLPLNNNEN
jgi:large subunit ribosomal protein L3